VIKTPLFFDLSSGFIVLDDNYLAPIYL